MTGILRRGAPPRFSRVGAALLLLCACAACAPAHAGAAQTVHLNAEFSPNKLGATTTISFAFTIEGAFGATPAPLTNVDLHLPAGLGLVTATLGLAICEPPALIADGVAGCSGNARVGYGAATAEVPYGPETVRERVAVDAFLGAQAGENLTLLFFAEGWSPVFAQLVFPGKIFEDTGPFGGRIDTALPIIPSVPDGPDVSVVEFHSTIGPRNITYYHRVGGRRVPFHPTGVSIPSHCPRGGFPFAADFTFQDGTHTTAKAAVPCPQRPRRATR